MNLYFDNCISSRIVRFINELELEAGDGFKYIPLKDEIPENSTDPEFLSHVSNNNNSVVISADKRILTNPVNKRALKESGVTIFILPASYHKCTVRERASRLLDIIPEIIQRAKEHPKGHIFKISNKYKIQDVT